ncbi:MAG: RNA polymerase sigma-70 factor [Gemmatimonadaceae bacterium]|nr:RNA polymerase sigma-70 factor [Gemmatimonadaceae bacterium]
MRGPLPASTELPSDLLPRLRLGDVAAFESLFRATHASLVAFATRYTGDEARAAELVQDLFLDLWTRRGSLEVRGSLRGYLFGAVRNRALNVRRRDALEHDWAADEAHDAVRALHPAPPVADAAYESAELAERVRAAMDALPARCALVMQLRWREGLGYAEIAQVMGISTKGVENQLARGLKALRAVLA